jgi:hypothetical protein
METDLIVVVMRSLEKIAAVAGGILAVWIGYKLFSLVPHRAEGEAKIAFPGGFSLFATRVGPGVFFALFGTGLIAYTVTSPVSYEFDKKKDTGVFNGMSGSSNNSAAPSGFVPRPAGTPEVESSVRALNVWFSSTAASLDGTSKNNIRVAIREAKLSMMREIWDREKWGDYDILQNWAVENGETGALPAVTQEAKAIYEGGTAK